MLFGTAHDQLNGHGSGLGRLDTPRSYQPWRVRLKSSLSGLSAVVPVDPWTMWNESMPVTPSIFTSLFTNYPYAQVVNVTGTFPTFYVTVNTNAVDPANLRPMIFTVQITRGFFNRSMQTYTYTRTITAQTPITASSSGPVAGITQDITTVTGSHWQEIPIVTGTSTVAPPGTVSAPQAWSEFTISMNGPGSAGPGYDLIQFSTPIGLFNFGVPTGTGIHPWAGYLQGTVLYIRDFDTGMILSKDVSGAGGQTLVQDVLAPGTPSTDPFQTQALTSLPPLDSGFQYVIPLGATAGYFTLYQIPPSQVSQAKIQMINNVPWITNAGPGWTIPASQASDIWEISPRDDISADRVQAVTGMVPKSGYGYHAYYFRNLSKNLPQQKYYWYDTPASGIGILGIVEDLGAALVAGGLVNLAVGGAVGAASGAESAATGQTPIQAATQSAVATAAVSAVGMAAGAVELMAPSALSTVGGAASKLLTGTAIAAGTQAATTEVKKLTGTLPPSVQPPSQTINVTNAPSAAPSPASSGTTLLLGGLAALLFLSKK